MALPSLSKLCAAFDSVDTNVWLYIDDDVQPLIAEHLRDATAPRGMETFRLLSRRCKELSESAWKEQKRDVEKLLTMLEDVTITPPGHWIRWLKETEPKTLDLSDELYYSGGYTFPNERTIADVVLSPNSHVTELILSDCNLTADRIAILAKALGGASSLQRLHLDENPFGAEGAKHLANALKTNTALQRLFIQDSSLHDQGAIHIAESLETNTHLQVLNMGRNNIGELGFNAISRAIAKNETLRELLLTHNRITDASVTILAEGLQKNTGLAVLACSAELPGDLSVQARHELTAAVRKRGELGFPILLNM